VGLEEAVLAVAVAAQGVIVAAFQEKVAVAAEVPRVQYK
jgi:hypothetical protein